MDKPRLLAAIQNHLPHWKLDQIQEYARSEIFRQEEELVLGILRKQSKEDLNDVLLFEQKPIVDVEIKKTKKK